MHHAIVRPATARLGVIGAYFTIFGTISAIVTAGVAGAMFFPRLGWTTTPAEHPIGTLAVLAFMTIGFLRTSRLLKLRQRNGAWLAATCFLVDIGAHVGGASGSASVGWPSVAIAGVGLALTASVWRDLE